LSCNIRQPHHAILLFGYQFACMRQLLLSYLRHVDPSIALPLLCCWMRLCAQVNVFFSAHGVPKSYVEEAGDPYKEEMEECVALIMAELQRRGRGNEHTLAYQSRVGPVEWLQPYTDDSIRCGHGPGAAAAATMPQAAARSCSPQQTRWCAPEQLLMPALSGDRVLLLRTLCLAAMHRQLGNCHAGQQSVCQHLLHISARLPTTCWLQARKHPMCSNGLGPLHLPCYLAAVMLLLLHSWKPAHHLTFAALPCPALRCAALPCVHRELGKRGVHSLLAVPISFVSEHIETLEEIDMEYRELALESGVKRWGRVPALNTNARFIEDLADAVLEALPYVGVIAGAPSGNALVPMGELLFYAFAVTVEPASLQIQQLAGGGAGGSGSDAPACWPAAAACC
jgi:hypothetical protein